MSADPRAVARMWDFVVQEYLSVVWSQKSAFLTDTQTLEMVGVTLGGSNFEGNQRS